ncbi:putative gpi-anchor transamidase precursor protein [Phaeoacremonium minimum UCRPA7]|uniref:Putative gpi-anchor transamidase protein n=1 Tax=Phaeoacremonium minimum (strain UCR-PA7) TaxID=1286976 RepID=R8BP90_PHAM7|nr:putative gpi-anchor transamidase precursor protein [Phaeoacremonium minimum UCRPA7]EOO01157.1 putative gpi-anchor transamidase precursor protein [Phaeoacremonium minimum UCRPA7]
MCPTSKPDVRSQILPLRGLNLQSKPFNKRAIAWSCDAELAVAADDSVHVFLPEFPESEEDAIKAENDVYGDSQPQERYDDEGDDDDDEVQILGAHPLMTSGRQQFFEGTRQFPVTYPPLNTEINRHIWDAAGEHFPELDDAPPTARPDDAGDSRYNPDPYLRTGAGARLIGSVGSTLNHVVAIEWSPSGIGRNGRPVLSVLTASGVLAMYGEGSPNLSSGAKGSRSTLRDLSRWVVLWAVGEKFVVPGQENYGERIISFAWAPQLNNGAALLTYLNDEQELVILSMRTEYKTGGASQFGDEEAVWHVREECRLKMAGPHPVLDQWDPEYTPSGSAFALKCSPWTKNEKEWTCLLSYLDSNYIGFRKITLENTHDNPGLKVQVEEQDWSGICLFLGPDAFVEWEDIIWTEEDDTRICRGIIATPFKAQSFEVNLTRRGETPVITHSTETCRTTYRDKNDSNNNPIQGLVIHPLNPATRTIEPLYTLIRLSATATNNDWFETNAPGYSGPDQSSDQRPQWAVEIAQKISVATPAGLNASVDDSDEDDSGESEKGGGAPLADSDADSDDENMNFVPTGPDIHPTRMRLWGLAQSPGGGSTAVLATPQMTQFPERGGWHSSRSNVMFSWTAREANDSQPARLQGIPAVHGLTTEGRVWEWMYGTGAGVPGVTSGPGVNDADTAGQARRLNVKHLFADAVRNQTCAICNGASSIRPGAVESMCEKGHIFATCGASDLAIQQPGISRACGVCRCRCLKIEELVKVVPDKADVIRAEVLGDVCMKCGGKFIN